MTTTRDLLMPPSSDFDLLDYFKNQVNPGHIILIDPDSQTSEQAANRCIAAITAGSKMIFVGGSTGTDGNNVDETVIAIKNAMKKESHNSLTPEIWDIPVILFPACANAFSSSADGITFMMLMNSSSPRFLIEEQLMGSPAIKLANVTPISMGYVVCEPGGKVGEIGKANLIKSTQIDLMTSYAICAEFFGFSLLYLEAGSGAKQPVSSDLIKAARDACNLTIIVGGGILDGNSAKIAIEAGADWVVTGNLTEQYDDNQLLQETLRNLIEEMN
ncbi:MAG: phosphoglycerol geranylgeranyltransferase [Candidatus Thalassarchaeaceae archaeon]|nr:phosphoglycerol geranylgeranyltransferase [Candidatus Thalassarchaeaceae archaeon]